MDFADAASPDLISASAPSPAMLLSGAAERCRSGLSERS